MLTACENNEQQYISPKQNIVKVEMLMTAYATMTAPHPVCQLHCSVRT